ncbi:MAG TPA: DUF748 domain-containing protein [Phycisphaerales bacterium]|nr:DUF748 domain-containing protein [Phycisphaerales bacterium]HMP36928.1 DUF748 domain-containing protein [Phycisphaerales bacterium]
MSEATPGNPPTGDPTSGGTPPAQPPERHLDSGSEVAPTSGGSNAASAGAAPAAASSPSAPTGRGAAPAAARGFRGWCSRRGRWSRRALIGLPAAVVAYTLFGFFGVPLLLKHVASPLAGRSVEGTISLRRAEFNPYTFRLLLEGLRIDDRAERETISFAALECDFEPWRSLTRAGWHFRSLRLSEPFAFLELAEDGTFNLAALLPGDPERESKPLTRIPHVVIDAFTLDGGRIRVDDHTLPEPFEFEIGGVAFTLEGLDTDPRNANPHHLLATTDSGATVEWIGEIRADPFSSKGTLTAEELLMPRFMPYAMRFTDARVVEGRLALRLSYDFAPVRTPREANIRFEVIEVDDLIVRRAEADLIRLPTVRIEGLEIDADSRAARVASVSLRQGHLRVERDDEGVLDVVRMLVLDEHPLSEVSEEAERASERGGEDEAAATAAAVTGGSAGAASPAAGSAEPDPSGSERVDVQEIPYPIRQLTTALAYLVEDVIGPWSFELERLAITEQRLELTDRAVTPSAAIAIERLTLHAGPVRSSEGFAIPYALLVEPEEGVIASVGTLRLEARSLDCSLLLDGVRLDPGDAYLSILLSPPLDDPQLVSARAFIDGQLSAEATDEGALRSRFTGRMRFEEAELIRRGDAAPKARVGRLLLDGQSETDLDEEGAGSFAWTGSLLVDDAEGAARLLAALGLGDAEVFLPRLLVEGGAWGERRADGLDVSARGRLALEGARTAALEVAGPVDLQSRLIAAEGSVGLSIDPRLRAIAAQGRVDLDEFRLAAFAGPGLGTALDATTIDGTLTARLPGAGAPADAPGALDASVRIGLGDATLRTAELEGEGIHLTLRGGLAEGTLAALLDERLRAEWAGSIRADAASVLRRDAEALRGEAGALLVDGRAAAALPRGENLDAAAIDWIGRVQLGPGSVGMGGDEADALKVGADRLDIDGALGGSLDGLADAWRFTWDGTVTADGGAFAALDLAGPIAATVDRLTIAGPARFEPSEREAVSRATHTGTVGALGIAVDAPELLDATTAAIAELRLDGALGLALPMAADAARSAPPGGAPEGAPEGPRSGPEAPSLEWNGTLELGAADVGLRTRGDPASALALRSAGLRSRTTLATDAEGGLRWSGDVAISPSTVVLGSVEPIELAAEATTLDGSLEHGERSGRPMTQWRGEIALSGVRGARARPADVGDRRPDLTVAAIGFKGEAAAGETTTVAGDVSIEGAATAAEFAGGTSTLAAGRILASGVAWSNEPAAVAIEDLDIEAPTIDGDVTLIPRQAATPHSGSAAAPAAAGPAPSPTPDRAAASLDGRLPLAIRLGSVNVSNGRLELRDLDADPPAAMLIEELTLAASGISSEPGSPSAIEGSARFQSSGRMTTRGTLDLFSPLPNADLTVTLVGVPLPPMSALSGRYAGWRIDEGRLSLTLPITIDSGKVTGELDFLLDRIALGAKVDSPQAPGIPLDLGLALLRDPAGQIKGQVPFSGNMTEPQFSFGGLIWQAVLGLLGRVVTAPFQLIASLFAGDGNLDLSFVDFEPGSSEVPAAGLRKIDALGQGLIERPQLELAIAGFVNREADIAAIRPVLLSEQVLRRVQESFPTVRVVAPDLYRQIVMSIHAGLPEAQRAPGGAGGAMPPFDGQERAVLATIEVPDAMLRDLAAARAARIAEIMTREKGIAADRVTTSVPEEFERAAPGVVFEMR